MPYNLAIYFDQSKQQLWEKSLFTPEHLVIATDGAVKNNAPKDYELSGIMTYSDGALTSSLISVGGIGNSSYNAETEAILKALTVIETSYQKNMHSVTDCLSFLTKATQWRKWDTSIESKIAEKITRITKNKTLSFHHVTSHNAIGINCAVDELITVAWHKIKNSLGNVPMVPKTHQEVKEAIKSKLTKDHTNRLERRT